MTRAELAAAFEREEAGAAECLALEFAIQDAGGWDALVRIQNEGKSRS